MASSGSYFLTPGNNNASILATDDCAIPGFEENGIAVSARYFRPLESSALEEDLSSVREESFLKLLRDVAERLGSSDVEQMELFEDIPEPLKGRSALALLTELRKRGKLSSKLTEPLIRLLKAIQRHDVADTLVVAYRAIYPDEEDCPATHLRRHRGRRSLPARGSPRIEHGMRIRRTNTAESECPPKIVVESPRPKLKHSVDHVEPSSEAILEQRKPSSLLVPPFFNGAIHAREKEQYPHTFSSSPHSESEKWSNNNVVAQLSPSPTETSPSRQYMFPPHTHVVRSISAGNSPPHSSPGLTGMENTSEVDHLAFFRSSSSSNIHVHVHLPPTVFASKSSDALLGELKTGGGENESIRARLWSAPAQSFKECRLQTPTNKPVDPSKNIYQRSDKEKSDYSGSDVDSEEQDGPGGKALTMKIDAIPRERMERKKRKDKSEMTHRDKSPEDFVTEKGLAVGTGNIPKAKEVETLTTSKPLINGLSASRTDSNSRLQILSRKIFSRKRRNKKGHQQCISWSVQREEALKVVCEHREQASLRCHQHLPVEAHSEEEHNPYLTFQLFPYGLFEDKGKSMTLFVKIIIPDECPPIHPSTKLYLSVRIHAEVGKEQRLPQLESRVNSCVCYIFKLLSHKSLLEMSENELIFQISACTAP